MPAAVVVFGVLAIMPRTVSIAITLPFAAIAIPIAPVVPFT